MTNHPTVDASVHVFFESDGDLRQYLGEPWASRGFPSPDVSIRAPLGNRYAPGTQDSTTHPGSQPDKVRADVLKQGLGTGIEPEAGQVTDGGPAKFDFAVLHPMTVGVLPDWHLESAILEATNRMLAERWLEDEKRFFGTIRVNPNDLDSAVKEIARWKNHRSVVQIGLPMQTQEPYGRPHFRPLWRAACDAGLPVAIHWEQGMGITHPRLRRG